MSSLDKAYSHQPHLVVIETYEGLGEVFSDELAELDAARAIGLPIAELAELLDCRVTVLSWQQWQEYEIKRLKLSTPVTQSVEPRQYNSSANAQLQHVQHIPIPARDPDYNCAFQERGLSPRSYGLIHDGGFLFFAACCLHRELHSLYQQDPFDAVILPRWGGLGYVAQMARATLTPDQVNVPFAVVVTDRSANSQIANQEGLWTRHTIIRRQMEDVSLALADLVLVFGPRGKDQAIAGRLPESAPPVIVPRAVDASTLESIAAAVNPVAPTAATKQFFLYEPQQEAAGVLTALDAVHRLVNQGVRFARPVISAGPPMVFAPMNPRDFKNYWSSRGFVRELVSDRQWHWQRAYPQIDQGLPIRLYPSRFDHLPNIWTELARGSFVVLSPAAAEGLAPGGQLPPEVLLPEEVNAATLAAHLEQLVGMDNAQLEKIRRDLCQQVVHAHQAETRQQLLTPAVAALRQLLSAPSAPQDLSRVALLFGDRRLPLKTLAQTHRPPSFPDPSTGLQPGALTVVITCYEIGSLLQEALDSIWHSERKPDEVILVDDGSRGAETLGVIQTLKEDAATHNYPLRVIHQRNAGLAAARNTGLAAATGEFISFLDGDDLIEPPFYRVALQLLAQYPTLGGIAAWASIFGADVPDGLWHAPQAELPFLLIENTVIVPCVTRTALLRQLGGYDIRQRYNYEDWELSVRLLASGFPIITVPMPMLRYRIRGDSLYRTMTDVQNQVMRELFMDTHRDTVAKFAVEVAMQLEHQAKLQIYANTSAASLPPNPHSLAGFLRSHPLMQRSIALVHRILDGFK